MEILSKKICGNHFFVVPLQLISKSSNTEVKNLQTRK